MSLSPSEINTAVNALRTAATQYDKDAMEVIQGGTGDGSQSLAEQFRKQARDARELALKLEE